MPEHFALKLSCPLNGRCETESWTAKDVRPNIGLTQSQVEIGDKTDVLFGAVQRQLPDNFRDLSTVQPVVVREAVTS